MLSIFETGEASYRLANQRDEDVGWIRGSALGFDGFATEREALDAAVAGSEALTGYIERLTGASLRSDDRPDGRVRLAHDGAYEWVTRGVEPLARLYRPERDHPQPRRRRTFGVEFVLPSYVKPGAAVSASQVVYHAIAARPTRSERAGAIDGGAGGRGLRADAAGAR
ncbi:MAG TPA: hypothetical protein VFS08_09595 [Gemmatimonadaceae bacterium]|nr:hypothetical protein [Gemmatimonadaceae bacterium]